MKRMGAAAKGLANGRAKGLANEGAAGIAARATKRAANGGVNALARGLQVLRAIEASPGLTLRALHEATALPKPTLLRLLKTLCEAGYAHRRLADGAYFPEISDSPSNDADAQRIRLAENAAPALAALHDKLPWPTDLGVRDGTTMLVLESNRRLSTLKVNRGVLGFRPHMLWSAVGRAYLAWCPDAEREGILAALRSSTAAEDRKARDRRWIDALLAQTRRQGYGVRDPRHASIDASSARAVSAIAVPVLGRDRVIACLNCVWLSEVASEAQIVERYLGTLRDAAADIARREEHPARRVVASSGRSAMVRTNLGSASSRRT